MATLGDKKYSYTYYGDPVSNRIWGTFGVSDSAYAALTYLNMWQLYLPTIQDPFTYGVYWEHDGATSETYGKPLDDSIALWHIPRNCSFACNAVFNEELGDTLKPHYEVNVHPTDAPLAMCAVDTHMGSTGNFITDPRERWAYDVSNPCDGAYSAMIYDIVYNKMCLQVNGLTFDLTNPTASPAGKELYQVASFINGDPENRFVSVIRNYIYRGYSNPQPDGDPPLIRYRTATGIPPQVAETFTGMPLIDTLTDRPIPSTETHLQDYIKDGHDERRVDVVYSPFAQKLGTYFFGPVGAQSQTESSTSTYSSQLEIGISRSITLSQARNGIATIPNTSYKITGQFYRCNYDVKDFDDVRYQWENMIIHTESGTILSEGSDITQLPNSNHIRFMTRLRILDPKGKTIGEATERAIKHEVAYIGMFFTDSINISQKSALGSGNGVGVYLPMFERGVTTGEYVTGTEILDYSYATAGSVSDDTFKYDPEKPSSDSGDLTTHLHSDTMQGSTQWYAFGEADLWMLTQWLNTTYRPSTVDQFTQDFKGVNPSDYIVSIRYYPFDVPNSGTKEPVTVGGISAEVGQLPVQAFLHSREYGPGKNSYFDLGSFEMKPPYVFGDFRDTYLKILLYIPWCGFVTLDPSLFTQSPNGEYHTISAALSIDFANGNALGMIYRDNLLIDTVNGTVGVDIPMTAVANGSYQNTITQTEIALKNAKAQQLSAYLSTAGSVAGLVVSAATGNVVGVAASAGSLASNILKDEQISNTIDSLNYQLSHTAPAVGDISSASPFNNALSEKAARIFIFMPQMLNDWDNSRSNTKKIYAQTVGYACVKQGYLSEFSGLTVCSNFQLNGLTTTNNQAAITSEEAALLSSLLTSGIII